MKIRIGLSLVSILLIFVQAGRGMPDHTRLVGSDEGMVSFSVPSLGICCRYKPVNVIHRDWPGERQAALACGRRGPPNQRFVLEYTGAARIERGRGNRDCCHGGPALTPGRQAEFNSIFACRIEGESLRCQRRDGVGFIIDPKGGHAY